MAGPSMADDYRRTQPAPGPASAFAVPRPTRFTVAGLDVALVERHDLPVVTASLVWSTGALADPRDKAGLAALCAQVLNEGPDRLPKVAFAEAQADLAATVGLAAGTEQTTGSIRALASTFPAAFDLFIETVARPGLRLQDFQRVQSRVSAAVLQQKGSPDALAGRLQGRVVWGEGHPLGAIVTDESLARITVEDCRAFATQLGPRGARLYVVGDVTREALAKLVSATVVAQRWKGKAPTAPTVAAPRVPAGGVVIVDLPGATQSVVAVLGEGPPRSAKDHEAQSVVLSILGGGFSSRINMNLRERHGYTYGARAGVAATRTRGVFSMTSSVRTDVTGPAIREMVFELRAMQSGVVRDEELARERDGALLSFPARFATGQAIGEAWAVVDFFGLPADTWDKTPGRLQALDKGALARAARTAIPREVTLLVVGDVARIGADVQQIAAEGLFGDDTLVRRLDVDGTAVAPTSSTAGSRP
jgi:zinc protease